MKILITGAAGYLGSVLSQNLLQEGHHVTALDNLRQDENSLALCYLSERFEAVNGDCRDSRVIAKLLDGCEAIVPLAGIVGAKACDRDYEAAKSINAGAVSLLCSLASKSQIILYPNTNSGYGIGGEAECTEESPLNPISLYGKTKCEGEKAVMHRENSISLRLATVFGVSPRMRTDLLVNDLTQRAVCDRTAVVFEGHFRRNYIHVRDIARAFNYCLSHFDAMKGEIYNCGLSDANLTKIELCAKIKQHVPEFVYMEAPIGADPDKRDYNVSNRKIEAAGFRTAFSIDDGIRELVKFYRVMGNRRYANA